MKVQFKTRYPKYRELTSGNVYRVIGIEADQYRIMNDEGRPFLYPPKIFHIVDAHEPRQWHTWYGEDGERYSYPKDLQQPGFFEDYFEGDRKAMATLQRYLATLPHSRETGKRKAG
jgi:hypothetical protein